MARISVPLATKHGSGPGRWPVAAALLALVVAAASPAPAGAEEAPIRRFALVVGANDGGPGRAVLRYAGTDAVAVAKVLVELGGVAETDRVLLLDPDRRTLEASFASLGDRLAGARTGGRVELIFYYSGHSDEEGLLLRGERFRYAELRRHLAGAEADVRVAILDSCASGALTREKGGVHRPPFLVDASTRVKGHAFLTSASADEAAQESDRLRASFFTHSLLTGLRGAADTGRDGRVTLNEAYHFAFQETLARTERTLHGPQHPNFDIQLVGTGDLVLTDLRGTGAKLRLAEALAGRVFVRDGQGILVAELQKPAGRVVELGIDPGSYRVTVDGEGGLSEARVVVATGWKTELSASALAPVTGEATASRGFEPDGTDSGYRQIPVDVTLFPGVSVARALGIGGGLGGGRSARGLALDLTVGRAARVDGAEVSFLGAAVDEDVTGVGAAGLASYVGGKMTGIQFSGLGNLAGQLEAVQAAGVVNVVRGEGRWAQAAGAVNWNHGTFFGAQVAGGGNLAGSLDRGLQLSGGANVSTGRTVGIQGAAGANVSAGRLEGLQVAAGANWAEEVSGLQAAGGFNYSGDVRGLQVAVLNVGGDVSGAQVGVVNVATGAIDAQVGVLNVAGDAAVPVGLLNLSREGIHRLDLWANETTPVNLSTRLGGHHVYGILTTGARGGDRSRITAGLGLGIHLDATEDVSLDVDVIGQYVIDPEGQMPEGGGNSLETLRLGVGYDLGPVSIFGGPTYNLLAGYGRDPEDRARPDQLLPGAPAGARDWGAGNVRLRGWPGFFLGMQL
jgi:hypothetical protein